MISSVLTPGITDLEKEMNGILEVWKIQQDRLKCFIVQVINELESVKLQESPLYQACHTFMCSEKYVRLTRALYATQTPSAAMTMLSSDVVLHVRDSLLQKNPGATALVEETVEVPRSAHGKIRHVGGMCVAKEIFSFKKKWHQIMDSYAGNLERATEARGHIELLEQLTDNEDNLVEQSVFQHSLIETRRRQNTNRSLTNISDKAFEFFVSLEKLRLPLFTSRNVALQQGNVLNTIRDTILNDSQLFEEWTKLFHIPETQTGNEVINVMNDLVNVSSGVVMLFEVVVQRYLNTCNSQYRQKLQSEMQNKKDLAHRKKIQARQEKASLITMADLDVSSSDTRLVSHLKLQTEVLQQQQALTRLTIPNLKTVMKWYKLKARAGANKMDLIKILKDNIVVMDTMPE